MTAYLVSRGFSEENFHEAVDVIAQLFPDFEKKKEVEDIDGSLVQPFEKGSSRIVLICDAEMESVIARTNIDINVEGFERFYEDSL